MSSIPDPSDARRLIRGRRVALGALIVVAGLGLAACSSSSPGASNSSTSSTAAGTKVTNTSGTSGLVTTSTSSVSPGSGELGSLISEISSAKHLTFSATYTAVGTGTSANKAFTYAQIPPKSLFEVAGIKVIDTGTETYSCSSASGTPTCVSVGTTDPLAETLSFVTGQTALSGLNALKSGIAQKLPNFSASFSTATYAGESAQCVSGTESTNTFKYCITSSGVLAYAGGTSTSGFGALTITGYSTSVSSSEFSLPAGATVVTLPSSGISP